MIKQKTPTLAQALVHEPPFHKTAERLPHVRHKGKHSKARELLSTVPGAASYTLVFEDDRLPDHHNCFNVVKVNSLAEVKIYYGLLDASCEMYLSPEYRDSHVELLREIEELQLSFAHEALAEAEAETVAALLHKVPLDLAGLLQSPLAVKDEDVIPGIIDPKVIHKKNPANALLTEPYYAGKLVYYNMLRHTEELRFDHESDHVQGMLLLEAMRQAGIATTHLMGGLPVTGKLILMSYCTDFYGYIEHDAPVLLRTYVSYVPPEEESEKEYFVICQAFQWGKLCAETTMGVMAFPERLYDKHRKRTEKITARNKRLFESKIKAAYQTVSQ